MKTLSKTILTALLMLFVTHYISAQDDGFNQGNALQNMIDGEGAEKFTIGAYAQIDYNQRLKDSLRYNGMAEVHRLVTFMGYRFSHKTMFVAEIEYEHVNELYVEQAYVNHVIRPWLQFRGGLLLIPMGIINEYHEPTIFNGVERPSVDNAIVPTTWREMGAGFAGKFDQLSLRYQLYLVNGPLSYKDGSGQLQGSNALRNGRQKGIRSVVTSPNVSAKIDWYGVSNLTTGLAAYAGKTQSTAFNRLAEVDQSFADSTIVSVFMAGIDARYTMKSLELRGQYILGSFGNTNAYNTLTGKDLGSSIYGFYVEAAYDVLPNKKQELKPFVRYEQYDTHAKTAGLLAKNEAFSREEIFLGLSYHPVKGVALKADIQFAKNKTMKSYAKIINTGIGIWF